MMEVMQACGYGAGDRPDVARTGSRASQIRLNTGFELLHSPGGVRTLIPHGRAARYGCLGDPTSGTRVGLSCSADSPLALGLRHGTGESAMGGLC